MRHSGGREAEHLTVDGSDGLVFRVFLPGEGCGFCPQLTCHPEQDVPADPTCSLMVHGRHLFIALQTGGYHIFTHTFMHSYTHSFLYKEMTLTVFNVLHLLKHELIIYSFAI